MQTAKKFHVLFNEFSWFPFQITKCGGSPFKTATIHFLLHNSQSAQQIINPKTIRDP